MGRVKGTPNKTTAILKDAILMAGTNAGNKIGSNGLVSYLEAQAEANPGPFMSLLGKVLPLQIAGSLSLEHVTKEQRDAVVAAATRANG